MIKYLFLIPLLIISLVLPSSALPDMNIADAKGTLILRKKGALGEKFKRQRKMDIPSFNTFGIGNYHARYELDSGNWLMIWMYVEANPPTVDEVVLFVNKATPEDVTHERTLQLLTLVYGTSSTGSSVIKDFEKAIENYKNAIKLNNSYAISLKKTKEYIEENGTIDPKDPDLANLDKDIFKSDKDAKDAFKAFSKATKNYIPLSYDKSLYYVGSRFGYKATYKKGGFELGIYKKSTFQHLIAEIQSRLPKLGKAPDPIPSEPPPEEIPEDPDFDW